MNTAVAPLLSESLSLYDRVVVLSVPDEPIDASFGEGLLAAGALVVFAGRHLFTLERTARELSPHRSRAIFLDSRRRQSCKEALASVIQRYGKIDTLINLVQVGTYPAEAEPAAESPLDDWQVGLSQGLRGAYYPSEVFGTQMARMGGGTIVNLALEARGGDRSQVIDLALTTRYLSEYFLDDQVRVNALSRHADASRWPAFVSSTRDVFPLNHMPRSDEAATALLYLAADASAHLNGKTLLLD